MQLMALRFLPGCGRRSIFIGACVLSLIGVGAKAEDLTAGEKAFLDQHYADVIKIAPVPIVDPAVAKVFATPFYTLNVTIDDGDGGSQGSSVLVTRRDDKLVSISRPGTDGDYPAIQKMFRPGFVLKNDADAKVVQAAFDLVYPIVGDEDKKVAGFTHAGGEWTFVRGNFFDKKMGFVLATDAKGAVTGVKYVLKLP
jgi:hypothetical protein